MLMTNFKEKIQDNDITDIYNDVIPKNDGANFTVKSLLKSRKWNAYKILS